MRPQGAPQLNPTPSGVSHADPGGPAHLPASRSLTCLLLAGGRAPGIASIAGVPGGFLLALSFPPLYSLPACSEPSVLSICTEHPAKSIALHV